MSGVNLERQLIVLYVKYENEWKEAYKENKLHIDIEKDEEYKVVIKWSNDSVVIKRFKDKFYALRTMDKVQKFVYNKLEN